MHKTALPSSLRPAPSRAIASTLALALTVFAAACSSGGAGGGSDPERPSGGTGGKSASSGGRGGSSSGGTGGLNGGGSTGAGGVTGSGGASGEGGAGGAAGAPGAGGATGSGGAAADASAETSSPPEVGTPPSADPGGGPMPSPPPGNPDIDNCMSPPTRQSPLTAGFKQIPCTFVVQSPHTVPRAARYSYDKATNTHTMFVNSNDSSFQAGNGTDPRCELRHQEEWTSGEHMFEAELWIDPRTHRTSILQHFSTNPPTSLMLTAWNDKTLRYYFGNGDGPIILQDAFGKWMNIKVLHKVATRDLTIYINDQPTMTFKHRGTHWHWKNGVYGSRTRSETRWRNIRHWVKE